jgi:hypothetical protein
MSSRIDVQNNVYDSPEISRNTNSEENQFQEQNKQEVVQSGEKNILHNYRSVTYNWTLAGCKKEFLSNPQLLSEGELDFVILKSGGKGTTGLSTNVAGIERKVGEEKITVMEGNEVVVAGTKDITVTDYSASSTVAGFNKDSPGRFDMFIDNVEIQSVASFSKQSNVSMPTSIKFEIIEPYSVNGFLEALYVTSIATGYTSYVQANFILKLEFKGYKDGNEFSDPETVPKSTRYFPITFSNIEVDITERGTRYRCEAVPANEKLFGEANQIKKPLKSEGNTVKEILYNLIKNLNSQTVQMYKDTNAGLDSTQIDEYFIKFKIFDNEQGWIDSDDSPLAKSIFVKVMKENALYKMEDPAETTQPTAYKVEGAPQQNPQPTPQDQSRNPEGSKLTPTKSVIHINENANVHEVIASVIRDSEYTKNLIAFLGKVPNIPDQFGMVDYFTVRIEVTLKNGINKVTKKPAQNITYVVSPYKIHYTEIPNYSDAIINESELKKLSLREYNYIYTGQNYDVINFRLNFNTLFFEALPAAMANDKRPSSQLGSTSDGGKKIGAESPTVGDQKQSQVPLPPKKIAITPVQAYGGNASQPLDDPYSVMARHMHEAVVNSKASLVDGKLEILGDPLFLITGGIGNINLEPEKRGLNKNGEANHLYGQLLITINFRNPIDILPLENGGTMFFDKNRVPFSGSYQVTEILSTFREGVFKQTLSVIRVPGQILDYSVKPTDPKTLLVQTSDPVDQVRADSSTARGASFRPSSATIAEQLSQGSSATTAADQIQEEAPPPPPPPPSGGLGGTPVTNLTRSYGLAGRPSGLFAGSSVIGQPLPVDVSSNIRLMSNNIPSSAIFQGSRMQNSVTGLYINSRQAKDIVPAVSRIPQPSINPGGLFDRAKGDIDSAAALAIATNVLTGNLPKERAIGLLATGVINSALKSIKNQSNVGSGIGEGATVSITNPADTSLPENQFSGTVEPFKKLGKDTLNAVSGMANDVGKFVGKVGDKIKSFAGGPADPEAVAAGVGINPSSLSGIDPKLQSKVLGQIKDLSKSIPSDVNLEQAVDTGLAFDILPSSKIPNIPPTAPYSVAPNPLSEIDKSYARSVVSKKGVQGLADLYGSRSFKNLSTNIVPEDLLSQVSNNLQNFEINPYKNLISTENRIDSTIIKDKYETSSKLISNQIGSKSVKDKSILGSVGSKFGSNASAPSPLDRLFNKLNDPNAPPYTGDDPIIRKRLGLPPLE